MSEITPITREEKLWNGEDLEPLTREEMYIKRIFDKTQTIPDKPLTRKEILMEKAGEGGGGDVTIKQLSVTANGTYSEEGTAYSPVNVNVPMPENAYLLKEASGSLVSFNDGTDLPMPSFVCDIDAVQDLHGYDGPWVGGAGKNKLPMTVDSIKAANTSGTWGGNAYTINGVTFTVLTDSDGNVTGIKANNKAENGNAIFYVTRIIDEVPYKNGESYIINGCPQGGTSSTYSCYLYQTIEGGGANHADDMGSGATITSQSTTNPFRDYIIVIHDGYTANNLTFYPMIRLSTETDPTFAPYSNICPISGHTGVNAFVRGKNLLPMTVEGIKAANTGGTWSGDVYSYYNVNYTVNTDNDGNVISIKVDSNNNTHNSALFLYKSDTELPLNVYIMNGCPANGSGSTYRLRAFSVNASSGGDEIIDYGNGADISNDFTVKRVAIIISANYTANNLVFKPMIRLATDTDAIYTPYNPNNQTIQVSWQTEAGEVYGGYVDLVSGVLTVTWVGNVYDGSNDEVWTIVPNDVTAKIIGSAPGSKSILSKCISNCFYSNYLSPWAHDNTIWIRYGQLHVNPDSSIIPSGLTQEGLAEWRTWLSTNNLQTVYELATPIEVQLTPTQIKSLLGNNNAWCDTGNVDVEYFGKGAE